MSNRLNFQCIDENEIGGSGFFCDLRCGLSVVPIATGRTKAEAKRKAIAKLRKLLSEYESTEPPPNPGIKKPGPADPGPNRSVSTRKGGG